MCQVVASFFCESTMSYLEQTRKSDQVIATVEQCESLAAKTLVRRELPEVEIWHCPSVSKSSDLAPPPRNEIHGMDIDT